jgi:hypothetical protein
MVGYSACAPQRALKATFLFMASMLLFDMAAGFSVNLLCSRPVNVFSQAASRAQRINVGRMPFTPRMQETQTAAEQVSASPQQVKERTILVAGATGRVGSRVVEEVHSFRDSPA